MTVKEQALATMRADSEVAEIRAHLWEGVADQTWCVCLGPEDGEHLQVIDGWGEYKALSDEEALDATAALLHGVGFRAGMSIDEAIALLATARESK